MKKPPSWVAVVGRQFALRRTVKATGTILGLAFFFATSFVILRHPLGTPILMPSTALDDRIGLGEAWLWPYVSLWFYVMIGPAVAASDRELRSVLAASGVAMLISMPLFWIVPTEVSPYLDDWSRHPALQFLKGADTAGNACPSLHVAFALLSAIWIDRGLRTAAAPRWPRVINAAWCVTIAYSTLATKQHVAIDVACGLALAVVASAAGDRIADRWWIPTVAAPFAETIG